METVCHLQLAEIGEKLSGRLPHILTLVSQVSAATCAPVMEAEEMFQGRRRSFSRRELIRNFWAFLL